MNEPKGRFLNQKSGGGFSSISKAAIGAEDSQCICGHTQKYHTDYEGPCAACRYKPHPASRCMTFRSG